MTTVLAPRPIIAISWVLQLPNDLGLPRDFRAELTREGVLHGWAGGDLLQLPRWEGVDDDAYPVIALRFRRAHVGVGMPTEATDRCFGDMQTASLSALGRRLFEFRLNRLVAKGVREWKTVVRISRWYAAAELNGHDDLDVWLRGEFRGGLSILNQWLATYALASASLTLGPLSPGDLPAFVPTVMEGKEQPASEVVYGHRLLRIHDTVPAFAASEGHIDAAEMASRSLATDWGHPFLDGLQLLFGAQTHLAACHERQAILDSGTAIEMIVSDVVRGVARRRDNFDGDAATRAPFRSRFEHHVPLALGDGVPAPDVGDARASWWEKGYLVRNAVVHEGHAADTTEAREAVESAWNLIDALGSQLREVDDTERLGEFLRVLWHEAEATKDDAP